MSRLIDLTGRRFGRWLVWAFATNKRWVCRCDCGTVGLIKGQNLRNGRSRSCGCQRPERESAPDAMKPCSKCGIPQIRTAFYEGSSACKSCYKEAYANDAGALRSRALAYAREHYDKRVCVRNAQRYRQQARDSYIKTLLSRALAVPRRAIPPDLIASHREELLARRLIKQAREYINEHPE